jgi:hypothetical protein
LAEKLVWKGLRFYASKHVWRIKQSLLDPVLIFSTNVFEIFLFSEAPGKI